MLTHRVLRGAHLEQPFLKRLRHQVGKGIHGFDFWPATVRPIIKASKTLLHLITIYIRWRVFLAAERKYIECLEHLGFAWVRPSKLGDLNSWAIKTTKLSMVNGSTFWGFSASNSPTIDCWFPKTSLWSFVLSHQLMDNLESRRVLQRKNNNLKRHVS